MFTGLVRDIGIVETQRPAGDGVQMTIRSHLANHLSEGDSLAVNGVCLTVVSTTAGTVDVTAVRETLHRSNLGDLTGGSAANLEPALRIGDQLGGHIVQGHVDGVATIDEVDRGRLGWTVAVKVPIALCRYIVEKGSIALDGVSLTVAQIESDVMRVAIIPHTLKVTTLGQWAVRQRINVEVDILAKHVEKLLHGGETDPKKDLTLTRLRECGFA